MITIQGFAKLCGCNAQTLRYYDRIGLLKPAKVDSWTGYRYYEEEQAVLFVKIKNLQQADFSIEEIRNLLTKDDDLLMAAFDRKVKEQEQKLARIREIQKSYLKESMDMQKMVNMLTDYVEGRMASPALWKELGLDAEQETKTRARVNDTLAEWLSECRNAGAEMAEQMNSLSPDAVKDVIDSLKNELPDGSIPVSGESDEQTSFAEDVPSDAAKVYERSGWEHVSEWINDIPDLESGRQSYFLFRVCKDSPVNDPGFPTLMLALMDVRFGAVSGGMNCSISVSGDGVNHFTLFQK